MVFLGGAVLANIVRPLSSCHMGALMLILYRWRTRTICGSRSRNGWSRDLVC